MKKRVDYVEQYRKKMAARAKWTAYYAERPRRGPAGKREDIENVPASGGGHSSTSSARRGGGD